MATTRVTKEGGDHLLGTLCSMAGGAKSFGRWGAGQTAAGGTRGLGSAFQLTFVASPVSHGMMEGWNIHIYIYDFMIYTIFVYIYIYIYLH